MEKITLSKANSLAAEYLENSDRKFIVYNIRKRNYVLHDSYRYFYRFSRRESVWNSSVGSIDVNPDELLDQATLADTIFTFVNQRVDDTLSLKLKKPFTEQDTYDLLSYYFNGKCYLAYYDYYLGRVVLIKERDKSIDFAELIGTRYYFIGDVHRIIKNNLDIDSEIIQSIMTEIMNSITPIPQIEGITELNNKLHDYISHEIDVLEKTIEQ